MALRKLIIDSKSQLDAMAKDNVVVKGTEGAPEVMLLKLGLENWNYRKPVTIDNSGNANTLTDYQILVTLDTQSLILAGKMKTDGGDIRFTDSDKLTLLNYWIESGMNTASTKIWVKVPSISVFSSKIIYVYYGNPSVSSASNGTNTFEFFDDFSEDLSKWDTWHLGGTGIIDTLDGKARLIPEATSNRGAAISSKITPITNNFIVEYCRKDTATYHFRGFDIGTGNVVSIWDNYRSGIYNGYQMWMHSPDNQFASRIDNGIPTNIGTNVAFQPSDGAYHDFYFHYLSDGSYIWKADGITLNYGSNIVYLSVNKKIVFVNGSVSSYYSQGYIDIVKVRRYASPEPSSTLGTEEVFAIYASLGILTSKIEKIDAITLGMLRWVEELPVGTDITFATRTGPTEMPDESWSAWSGELSDPIASQMASPANIYIQFRVTFTTADTSKTPRLYRG